MNGSKRCSLARQWFTWLTPKYWVRRYYRSAIPHATAEILPRPYEPTTIAYSVRTADVGFGGGIGGHENRSDRLHRFEEIVGSKLSEERENQIGAAALGVTTAFDFIEAFSKIDHSVLQAATDLFHQKIETIADLAQRLEQASIGAALVDSLKGRVAEHVLFERLGALGVHAEMAGVFNQPGWDLTIDSVPVNSKLVADVSSVASHFAKYPEIPVVVPGDAANIPVHAVHFDSLTGDGMSGLKEALGGGHDRMVLVDDAMSHAELGRHTHTALERTSDHASGIKYRFPWVTLALSGWREIQLLDKGHTDLGTALANVSLDVAGTSLGAWGGAKAGALVGSAFGPLGAAVGGFLGVVGGAFLGRRFTNEIKEAEFKKAQAAYLERYQEYKESQEEENDAATECMAAARIQEEQVLSEEAARLREQLAKLVTKYEDSARASACLGGDAAVGFLEAVSSAINEYRERLVRERLCRSWFRRWIWPDLSLLACEEAIEILGAARSQLDAWASDARSGSSLVRADVYGYLGTIGFGETDVTEALVALERIREGHESAIREFSGEAEARLVEMRRRAMERLKALLEETIAHAREHLEPLVNETLAAQKRVEHEARKLGIKMQSTT